MNWKSSSSFGRMSGFLAAQLENLPLISGGSGLRAPTGASELEEFQFTHPNRRKKQK
ncbi:hypothetical protein ABE504_11660 [Paenibacillus oryzisoli]|uniref:hypothetical protein n=1 Tax=Paenibacillus oryzisoli TaxID=1850517 RepID=UPI003D2B315B